MPAPISRSLRFFLVAAAAALLVLAAFLIFQPAAPSPSSEVPSVSSAETTPTGSPASSLSPAAWHHRVSQATPTEFDALMREALTIPDPSLRHEIVTAITVRWLNADRVSYLAFLDAMEVDEAPDSPAFEIVLAGLSAGLTQLDVEAASDPMIKNIIQRVVEQLSVRDPEQAYAWASEWLLDEAKDQALAIVAPALVGESPERALEVLAQIETPIPRMDAMSELGTAYAIKDPAAALSWAKALTAPMERVFATRSVLAELAQTDPATASTELATYGSRLQQEYRQQVEADRVALGIRAEDEFNSPEEYATYVEENGVELPARVSSEVELLADTAGTVAWELSGKDPLAAAAWAESLPDGLVKSRARIGAMRSWAAVQPDAAIDHYLTNFGEDAGLAEFIYESWASRSPESASEGVNRMPDDAHREHAVAGVVNGWLDADDSPEPLVGWIDSLADPRLQDKARATVAEAVAYDYPETAWSSAARIQDPLARRRSLLSTFPELVAFDPTLARRALTNLRLPASDSVAFENILAAGTQN